MPASAPPPTAPTVVLTGATGGLGRLAARALARGGARLILPARDEARAAALAADLRRDVPGAHIETPIADLAHPREVAALGRDIAARHERVDVLVNNAGLHAFEARTTADRLPEMVAVNYLAPWILTRELLPALHRAPAARVVTVASEASRRHGEFRLPDALTDTTPFTARGSSAVYGRTKLLDIMFALELADRLRNSTITSTCLDPGFNVTGLGRELRFAPALAAVLRTLHVGDPRRGAGLIMDLAAGAEYAGRNGVYVTVRGRREVRPVAPADDAAARAELWGATEGLVAGHGW